MADPTLMHAHVVSFTNEKKGFSSATLLSSAPDAERLEGRTAARVGEAGAVGACPGTAAAEAEAGRRGAWAVHASSAAKEADQSAPAVEESSFLWKARHTFDRDC